MSIGYFSGRESLVIIRIVLDKWTDFSITKGDK